MYSAGSNQTRFHDSNFYDFSKCDAHLTFASVAAIEAAQDLQQYAIFSACEYSELSQKPLRAQFAQLNT